jgi:uncharacterized membrane protein (DUF4010 family)
LIFKVVGHKATWLGGVLGGVISSFATTVSYARLHDAPGGASLAALVIMIASTILYVRVLILIGAVASKAFCK